MSKYIVVKEREKIKTPEFDENKKREKLQSESVINTKEKESIEFLSVEPQKEKNTIPSQTIETTKTKLSFSPLIIEKEKTTKIIPSTDLYKEVQKNKITVSSKLTEKKNNFSLETVITKEKKNSPTFTPLKIENKSKENEKLNAPMVIVSKTKGNNLSQNQPMFSKRKEPLFAELTENKEDEELYNEYKLLQKEKELLDIPSTENKEDYKLGNLPYNINKKDTDLEEITPQNREVVELESNIGTIDKIDKDLESFMIQNKELLGITGEISEEDKNKLSLLIPEIENLATNGKIDPSKKIKEKGKADKDFWGEAKDWLEELLGFNLEIATLKSLLMPVELDKLLTDIKTFKGDVAHGNIIDSVVGGFNLTNELYDKISHFSLGELAGLYTANFFTITGFKPSISIKNPGRTQFGNDEWDGDVLMNQNDPFGSIEDESNIIFRKAGRFTDLRGLKGFGISQIGNLFKGLNKIKFQRNSGNVKADAIKANNTKEISDSAASILFNALNAFDPAIRTGDFSNDNFDPAIRMSGFSDDALNRIENIAKEKGLDLEKIGNFSVNNLLETLDPGNLKANKLKEANNKLLDPHIEKAIQAIGVGKGKLREGFKKLRDAGRAILGDLDNEVKKQEDWKDELGYEISSASVPDEIPHISLLNGDEYDEDKLNTLRKSIEENYNSIKIRNDYNLGYMIVEPADFTGKFENFKIDFQFNPEIAENSLEARYDSTTVLNRIGQIETYTGTDSIKASMKLQYRVLSKDPTKGTSWMRKWTLDYIQQIEMALRSLTVPANIGNRTTRPPVIRIELGAYSNLFKFPILVNQSQRWRYFIATSVTINKSYDGSSYYLDNIGSYYRTQDGRSAGGNLYARDMMGFDADINLTEVKKSYFTYYPNFNDYYDSVTRNSNSENLKYFVLPEGVN